MATIYTHAVAGLGIARLYTGKPMPWAFWGLAALLPVVPDLDAFSTAFYGGPWGHRGFTHSLAFALVLGMVTAGLTFRCFRQKWWPLAAVFFVIVASHGLLDACTWGGYEIPFFWPLPGRQGNWGPIPVSDIAFEFPDPRHSRAVRAELLWVWLPTAVLVGLAVAYRRMRRFRHG
jgi:inner membrane protein